MLESREKWIGVPAAGSAAFFEGGAAMATALDQQTIERFRALSPRQVMEQAKDAVYRSGAVSSDDFMDIYEQLVDQGLLSWEQIDEFDRE
jgi:hypothetical protein